MNAKPKVKLCWNCEGRVSLRDENCPYCAVYLHPESNLDDEDEDESLPEPPYRINPSSSTVPKAPYAQEETVKEKSSLAIPTNELKRIMMPLALLLFGSVFLLFGFILLFFSQQGFLTLRWDADMWYFYEILAVPLLYFGWKCLDNLKEDDH